MKKKTADRIRKFNIDRDWVRFNTPSNLAKTIVLEAAELLECFQWDDAHFDESHLKEELADVMINCQNMLDCLGYDADEIVNMKMDQNEAKYPADKARGKNVKYDKL